jgi:hypothetical protein
LRLDFFAARERSDGQRYAGKPRIFGGPLRQSTTRLSQTSAAQVRVRARESIEAAGETIDREVFDRFAARLSYVSGDFTDPVTYERVGAAIAGARQPVFYRPGCSRPSSRASAKRD